jgi:hypothetical protein
MRAVTQNPEGLFLLAAGVVLLMRKGGSLGRAIGGERFAHAGDSATKVLKGASDYVSTAADRANAAVGAMASSASDYAEYAKRSASEGSTRLMQQANNTYQGTMERVLRDKPLLVALAGAAAGVTIAAALPSSDLERQTLGPIGAQMTEAASTVSEQLKEAAGKAGESLKHAADGRGLDPNGLKEVATGVAGAFSNSLLGEKGPATSSAEPSTNADRPNSG